MNISPSVSNYLNSCKNYCISHILSLSLLFVLSSWLNTGIGQVNDRYYLLIREADALYNEKNYKQSALTYSTAFNINKDKGLIYDRYKAARAWALANQADSALSNLSRIILTGHYQNYKELSTEQDFDSLHKMLQWQQLLSVVKQNKEKLDTSLDKPELVQLLNEIKESDQKCRSNIEVIQKTYGKESNEMKILTQNIKDTDSSNLSKVKKILDYYGWLGPSDVGEDGSLALFLVLQHADLQTQLNYLPLLKAAIKNNKAKGGYLAMLEDRIATMQGKKQIYGTQIGSNQNQGNNTLHTSQYYILPLEDPDNVDKRRAAVGLEPLSDYVKHWNIKWDVEQYKKDLPSLLELQK